MEGALDDILWSLVRAMRVRTMVVFEAGRPYMARFVVQTQGREEKDGPPFRTHLHYLFASDDPDYFHDHPWDESQSLILTGGYEEERMLPNGGTVRKTVRPGEVNVIPADAAHRIELGASGVWTMFTTGRRHGRSWSFYRKGDPTPIPWRERNVSVKGTDEAVWLQSDDPKLEEWRREAAAALRA